MTERHDASTVQLEGVSKRFGGVYAVRSVSLTCRRGTVHALVGENGAGKSTVGKIIAGVHRHDAGTLRIDGEPVRFASPRRALADGVAMVAQELALVHTRSVVENVSLGIEPQRAGFVVTEETRDTYRRLQAETGFDIPPNALVRNLRNADQQKVEILRALSRDARVIVFDEPTARLTSDEALNLTALIRRLADAGKTIVYVSHFLREVLNIANDVTVLRDGAVVQSGPAASETEESLIKAMLGRPLTKQFPDLPGVRANAPVVCSVRGISRRGSFRDISFDVRAGEIVGLAGLVGSGRSEVARAIFGADRVDEGEIALDGRPVAFRSPLDAIRAGVAMIPEDRRAQGLMMRRPTLENVGLPHLPTFSRLGFLSKSAATRTRTVMRDVDVRGDYGAPVEALSGGNQQKALFAKWLLAKPSVLIVDEPTRGVDVAAKRSLYDLIVELAADGVAVLLISSEMEEVLELSHRVMVMRRGQIGCVLEGDDINEATILRAAFEAAEVEA